MKARQEVASPASSFTDYQRELIASAFRYAKARLWDGTSSGNGGGCHTFICCALGDWPGGAFLARRVILVRMGHTYELGTWLEEHQYMPQQWVGEHGLPARDLAMQQYRHRWLDALIEEFSN